MNYAMKSGRDALGAIIADLESGLVASHDIGERASQAYEQLKSLHAHLCADAAFRAPSAQLLASGVRMRIAAQRIEREYPEVAQYLRDAAKVFCIEISAAARIPGDMP